MSKDTKKKPVNLVARVNITYKGEDRSATIYDDGTAILDSGESVNLTPDQYEKIVSKQMEAERLEREEAARVEKERRAAKKAEREAKEAARQAKKEANMRREAEMKARLKLVEEREARIREQSEELAVRQNAIEEDEAMVAAAKQRYSRPSIAKIAIATVIYVAVVAGTLFGSTYLLDNYMTKVSVAQLSTPMAKDAQFTPDNLEQLRMPESVYEALNKTAPGGLVLWDNAQDVVGKYIAMDAVKGQYLSYDFISESRTMENPWIQAMEAESVPFTIQFDPYSTYNQLLFAGSHVRMKATVNLLDDTGKPTGKTEVMSVSAAAANVTLADDDDDYETVIQPRDVDSEGDFEEDFGLDDELNEENNISEQTPTEKKAARTVKSTNKSATDLFDDVVVVDIINVANESMFDVYLPLIRMTEAERRSYLTEKAESAGAATYFDRFTPMSLVLALNDKQESELLKVKDMSNVSISYTVLPTSGTNGTDEQNSMYLKFLEVQKDVNEIFGEAMTVKK